MQELDVQSRLQDKFSLPVPKLMYMDSIQLPSWKKGLTLPEIVSFGWTLKSDNIELG